MAQPTGDTIPQSTPLYISKSGKNAMVQNNMGGYVFKLNDSKRLLRFIIMGSEGGSFYVKEKELQRENVTCIDRLIGAGQGVQVVQQIKEISVNRRNVKQNALLLAYAICARCNDKDTKKAAYALLSEICRIPTHLFMFIKYCEQESKGEAEESGTGWGRAHKRAVSKWYTSFEKDPEKLARLVTKFKNRESWSHKDVVRLAHTSTSDKAVGFILRYITKGLDKAKEMYLNDQLEMDRGTSEKLHKLVRLIEVFDRATNVTDEKELCYLIKEHKLTWEQCNSELLKSKEVWIALLPHMPIEATIRNLGRMTKNGLFAENSEDEQMVLDKIRSINTLSETPMETDDLSEEVMEVDNVPEEGQTAGKEKRRNVLHPFKILLALVTYKTGHGDKGGLSWTPNQKIIEALDQAFYQAFDAVEPTRKKYYLAVDVSGSMSQPVLGSTNIHCATAAAAMMMVTLRTEEQCIIKGFSHKLVEIPVDRTDRLDRVQQKMDQIPMGGTDCAKPMFDAIESKIKDIDVFIVYTDNETWFGKVHPCEALRQYRTLSERPQAKLIVCGMCSNEFTIADQDDPNMLDIVGFDSAAPRLMAEFAMDKL
ncbi:RNA-binding protein RO60-like [Ruditapes philippinarum]|uniref:RNA-binding protein RO60-like n=1 Tax=Ruditapes philippinarum TaxID=129788 RepID=UPI00295B3E37|nr:RNA-binding protein RO60-like [Ruditapes philippinarum]